MFSNSSTSDSQSSNSEEDNSESLGLAGQKAERAIEEDNSSGVKDAMGKEVQLRFSIF